MADTMLIKGGKKATMPVLAHRELAVTTDTKELYVGINGVNIRLCGEGDKVEVGALPELAEGSDLPSVVSAYNSLIAALKASGIMK